MDQLYTQKTSTCMIQQEKKLLYSRHKVVELHSNLRLYNDEDNGLSSFPTGA